MSLEPTPTEYLARFRLVWSDRPDYIYYDRERAVLQVVSNYDLPWKRDGHWFYRVTTTQYNDKDIMIQLKEQLERGSSRFKRANGITYAIKDLFVSRVIARDQINSEDPSVPDDAKLISPIANSPEHKNEVEKFLVPPTGWKDAATTNLKQKYVDAAETIRIAVERDKMCDERRIALLNECKASFSERMRDAAPTDVQKVSIKPELTKLDESQIQVKDVFMAWIRKQGFLVTVTGDEVFNTGAMNLSDLRIKRLLECE